MAEIILCPACGVKNRVRGGMRGVPLCGKCKKPLPLAAKPEITGPDHGKFRIGDPPESPARCWSISGPRWCQPCRQMAAVLEKFAAARPGITVAKVDTDAEPGLASQFQIFSVPTLILFVKGREVHRVSGAMSESELAAAFAPWLEKK